MTVISKLAQTTKLGIFEISYNCNGRGEFSAAIPGPIAERVQGTAVFGESLKEVKKGMLEVISSAEDAVRKEWKVIVIRASRLAKVHPSEASGVRHCNLEVLPERTWENRIEMSISAGVYSVVQYDDKTPEYCSVDSSIPPSLVPSLRCRGPKSGDVEIPWTPEAEEGVCKLINAVIRQVQLLHDFMGLPTLKDLLEKGQFALLDK